MSSITLLQEFQILQFLYMKKQELNLKLDIDIFSSRVGSQVSSSRSMFHVGQPAIYIAPKLMPDENSDPESAEHASISKENSLQAICVCDKAQDQPDNQKQIKNVVHFSRFRHFGLTLLEGLVFCGFLMGSFRDPGFIKWFDLFINFVCGIKIVVLHLYIYNHNRSSVPDQTQGNSTKPNNNMYLNTCELYEMLQMWSLFCTCLLLLFSANDFGMALISTLRLVRLFFPFVMRGSPARTPSLISGHVIKIALCIFFTIVALAITMQLLLYNIDSYYCLTTTKLRMITEDPLKSQKPSFCGIYQVCPSDLECRNVYAFTSTKEEKERITQWLMGNEKYHGFSDGLLGSIWGVIHIGGQSYNRYRLLIIQQLLFPAFILLWLGCTILIAIGIGQAVRQESTENFVKKLQQKSINLRQTVCYPRSNSRLIQEYTAQVQKITVQLDQRTWSQKALTVLFHVLYLTQIVLIFCRNLSFTNYPNIGRDLGVALGIVFIVWSFGLGLAFYEWVADPNRLQSRVKTYTILYEVLAWSLCACDYVLRIAFGQYLFQSSTAVTPFSYAVVSLRILFVLYNNGFDADISLITEKMLQSFTINAYFNGFVLVVGSVLGFTASYWVSLQHIQITMKCITAGIGSLFNIGIVLNGLDPHVEMCLLAVSLLGVVVYICIMRNVVAGYSRVLSVECGLVQPKVDQEQEPKEEEEVKWRQHLKSIHQSTLYQRVNIAVVGAYVCVTLAFQLENGAANIFICTVEWLFLLHAISKCAALGLFSPLTGYPTILFMISCVFSIACFFLNPWLHPAIPSSLQASRCLLLILFISELSAAGREIADSLMWQTQKIYKLVIASSCLTLTGACLMSLPIGALSEYRQTSDLIKLTTLIGQSVGYVYGLKWPHLSDPTVLLCLQIIYISVVLILHGTLIYLLLSYFLAKSRKQVGKNGDEVINISQCETAGLSANIGLGSAYLKTVKLVVLFASALVLALVSGSVLEHTPFRHHAALTNLVLHLGEIFIYLIEGWTAKEKKWGKTEAALLLLSLAGSFLLIFPVIRYSGYVELSILVRIFLALSTLKLLRLFNLLTSVFIFSSSILRRVKKELRLSEIVAAALIWMLLTVPFAVCLSHLSHSTILTQMVDLLTGSFLSGSLVLPSELIPKIAYSVLIHFPLRMFLISKIIACFLPFRVCDFPSAILEDRLREAMRQPQRVGNRTNASETVPLHSLYRFCAKVDRIFEEFFHQKRVRRSLPYDQMMRKIRAMQIDVFWYSSKEEEDSFYGVFASDILRHFYGQHGYGGSSREEHASDSKGSWSVIKSHFTVPQYCAFLLVRRRVVGKARKKNPAHLNSNIVI